MSTIGKFKTLSKARESFSHAKFEEAMNQFAQVLQSYPNSKEAHNGVILSEMALSGESGAEALFDYYEVLRSENREEADFIMSEILQNMDTTLDKIGELLSKPLDNRIEYEDGILYNDFKQIVAESGDFKKIFENIMFSTKVIITSKDDFLDFLDNLIENNFEKMALTYLENTIKSYPSDELLQKLLLKLSKKGGLLEN
ncbi:MAG: hypothetical protein U9P38_03580 [Campylobacterota bacterium]|nr:hypothetical protein [Campylobacterota bacterium]